MIMNKRLQGFNITIIVLSGMALAYIAYPLITLLVFVEPTSLPDGILRPQLTKALILSLFSATVSTLILCLFGVPLSYFLARFKNFPGKFILRIIVIVPLVLPPLAS